MITIREEVVPVPKKTRQSVAEEDAGIKHFAEKELKEKVNYIFEPL
jgi:hypothetical protein